MNRARRNVGNKLFVSGGIYVSLLLFFTNKCVLKHTYIHKCKIRLHYSLIYNQHPINNFIPFRFVVQLYVYMYVHVYVYILMYVLTAN